VSLALAYGAKGLWWYPNRTTHAESIAPINADWNPTPIWDEIGKLHAAVEKVSGLLLRLDPDPSAKLAEVSGEGIFAAWHKRREGSVAGRYVVVVNESLREPREALVQALDAAHRAWDITSGKTVEAKSTVLEPGGGALFFVGPEREAADSLSR